MGNKIKLIIFTILIPAVLLEIIFIAFFVWGQDYIFNTNILPIIVGISSILCGIFVSIKISENVLGKIAYAILTSIIATIIFGLLSILPLIFLAFIFTKTG
ncbi:hypothetical protein A2422_04405 [Candidatus Woesebacteria bacterium RIFOXYC1_FULL_31_51]|uniref:Uncharacterized protein n=1 Tax=Candidatus Woesebacteria bacterium GW2011_GWC2_31_9 TaxID=1618586 RepID=A0A0F9YI26_9BACT|nr:MAG: hypothetical protein UR17_C0001G0245 [Candidatus Woesebacteria bacterium GW2011_GWF1_31_35]KKP23258.1 MAG: hypothetical protein UR11_C0001G0232 [Candidatus Woesebacteria bacterium GW2011_GWC1_30_29]KKP25490.1 MAG: hypothetical protein UR13_C0008G0006 [Candidatus Woesebacteria bacterium GW2011_GWD1_31_12]KKP27520.1 MAG: hypothetical protein UR16_C0003G0180 [Candidatus Woesebacteria bacterium GW2011_GWB1_31_29]KKP30160.1 MAG: hypothetical protein UR20_C0056G0003 [Candidatus Woesebacteria 